MRADRRAVAWAVVVSLGTHLSAMLALTGLPERTTHTYDASFEPSQRAEAARLSAATSESRTSPEHAPPPTIGGPESAQNVDARRAGGGGDISGATEYITLVTRTDNLTLVGRIANAAEANQMQRIRTARDRATPWQGRATPTPSEAAFLASGEGTRRERRIPDPRDAAPGVRSPEARTAVGGAPGTGAEGSTRLEAPRPGTEVSGRTTAASGAGVSRGTGTAATTRADVAPARPALDRGLPTVPAEVIYELPRDTVDSEALTARLSQSFVDTSRRAARQSGTGAGGAGGPGEPGSGAASGTGGHSTPFSPGPGNEGALDISSGRYRSFYLALRREVERHLTFPRARALALDQGHAVFRITLRRNGTLARPPQLVRSTGFDDLDAVSRQAIELARFEALPVDLSPTAPTVSIRISIQSRNPVAR